MAVLAWNLVKVEDFLNRASKKALIFEIMHFLESCKFFGQT